MLVMMMAARQDTAQITINLCNDNGRCRTIQCRRVMWTTKAAVAEVLDMVDNNDNKDGNNNDSCSSGGGGQQY